MAKNNPISYANQEVITDWTVAMSQTILLVEDNKKLSRLIKERLVAEGYSVNVEYRGDNAVYRIIHEQPDLVILDIMLPGLDGKQICQTVRNDYKGKILMLTALDDEHSEVASLNNGADDYLTKPIADAILKAHVTALLRRPTLIEPATLLKFDSLQIDLSRKTITLGNSPIKLSPSEFELLALLASNHDTTLSRDTITRSLHGREYDGVDRSIDIRIGQLRKLLNDRNKKPPRIKTIHGKGYLLDSTTWKER